MKECVDRFFDEGNEVLVSALPRGQRALTETWVSRLRNDESSIVFLPRTLGSRSWWYAVAPDAKTKRELLELLDAWIGTTFSDLPTRRGSLDHDDQFDRQIGELCGDRTLKFEVLPSEGDARGQADTWIWSKLRLLDDLLDRRPTSSLQGARQTGVVLDDLGLAISAGDRELAERLLQELGRDGGLDETNIAFQRLRVLAGLGAWAEVLADPSVPDLLGIRRPPGVTRALVRAVYEEHLSQYDRSGDDLELLASYRAISDGYGGLVRGSPEPNARAEFVVQCLAAIGPEGTRPMTAWIDRLFQRADAIEPGLGDRLQRLLSAARPEPTLARDPFDEAQDLFWAGYAIGALERALSLPAAPRVTRLVVLAAADVGTVEAATQALAFFQSRPADERLALAAGGPFQAAVAQLERSEGVDTPTDWRGWLARVEAGAEPGQAVAWVHDASDGWALLTADDLKVLVEQASDKGLAVIGEVSGTLLAAHREVIGPSELAVLGERLLVALALSDRRSAAVQAQAASLIDFFFQGAPTAGQVASALEALGVLVDSMATAGNVDWLADLLGVSTYYYSPEGATSQVLGFAFSIADHLRRLRGSLTPSQQAQVEIAFGSLGLEPPADLLPVALTSDESEKYACLEGQHVVIYSLMESAARRASDSLRRLVPSVRIDNTSAHGGTTQLAELARHADVFVVVTAAAKHAATEFIEDHRAGPIVYVNSKGTSALLRGLAGVCA